MTVGTAQALTMTKTIAAPREAVFEAWTRPEEMSAWCCPDPTATVDVEDMLRQAKVEALKYRYRDLGHLLACMDPLSACPTAHPLLDLDAFGLDVSDMERAFAAPGLIDRDSVPLKEIVSRLKQTYCHSVGV